MLQLALLKGFHIIRIICNGGEVQQCNSAGEAIDTINSHLLDDDYERVIDSDINSENIILVFISKRTGRIKQFWITVDEEPFK